MRTILEQKGI
jgi:actin